MIVNQFTVVETMQQSIIQWIKARSTEKSTYKGLALLAAAAGLHLDSTTAQMIVEILASLIGFINVIRDEAND